MLTIRASTFEAREQMKREIAKMETFFPGLPLLATRESGKCRDAVQVLILSSHDIKRYPKVMPQGLSEGDLVQLSEKHTALAVPGPLKPGDIGKVRAVSRWAISVETPRGAKWEYNRAENLEVVKLLSSKGVSRGSLITLDQRKGAALTDCPLQYGIIGAVEAVFGSKVKVRKEERTKGKQREEWVYDDQAALTAGQGLPLKVGRKVTVVPDFEARGNAGQGPLRDGEWGHVLEVTTAVSVRLPGGSAWTCEDHNLLRIVVPATDTKTAVGADGRLITVQESQEVKKGRLVRVTAANADRGNALSGPLNPGEGFAEVTGLRALDWWVEVRGETWSDEFPGVLEAVRVPQEEDIFQALLDPCLPYPLAEDPHPAQLALALRRLGSGLCIDVESPRRPCRAEARVVLACIDEAARANEAFPRLLRAHALRYRAIVPVIMPGFDLSKGARKGEWWPARMPELREHALFVDLRSRAGWDEVIQEQLLPQVEKFLDEWRGDGRAAAGAARGARVECLECLASDVADSAQFERAELVQIMNRWTEEGLRLQAQGRGGAARPEPTATCAQGHAVAVREALSRTVLRDRVPCPACVAHGEAPPFAFDRYMCLSFFAEGGEARFGTVDCRLCMDAGRPYAIK